LVSRQCPPRVKRRIGSASSVGSRGR